MFTIAKFWTEEQIQHQHDYFSSERTKKRGKFTELVVRTYYFIYKVCSLNDGICCKTSEASAHKIKYIIYEGFYGGIPDHDNKGVIDDCVDKLKLMKYIKFKKVNDKWMIYLNRPLDFLLEGEHETYLDKYHITNNVRFLCDEE